MDAIIRGQTFYTIIKDIRGKWKKGNKVTLVKAENIYLNDDVEKAEEDRLASIPEF